MEFGPVRLTSVLRRKKKKHTFPESLRRRREDVLPPAAASRPDTGLRLEECVSCLSLFVSSTGAEMCLFVDRLFPPTVGTRTRFWVFQTTVPCKQYTKPPDILTISWGGPHSWPPLACAYLGQRSTHAGSSLDDSSCNTLSLTSDPGGKPLWFTQTAAPEVSQSRHWIWKFCWWEVC